MTSEREAWLARAAEQVRQYREEDRANGIIWADEREQTVDNRWRCTPPGLTVREMHDGDGIVPVLVPREGL